MRDQFRRFVKGRTESLETKLKRVEALKNAWKESPKYIDNLVKENPYVHNSWRGIMFNKKGKKAGVCNEWRQFNKFYEDVAPSYQEGHRLMRIDKSKPFSKDNCLWVADEYKSLFLDNTIIIEFDGEALSIK